MSHDIAALACDVCALARRAGHAILEIYKSDFAVTQKKDSSPLTEADLAANQLIKDGLVGLTAHWPVLSEESAAISWAERSRWRRYWLVDPLDGTREFVKRNDEFTVNIALIEGHRPVLGVVFAPALGEMYCAWEGGGAFRGAAIDAALQRLQVRPRQTPVIVVGSRSHDDPRLLHSLRKLGDHELRALGSSLKFCRIAAGEADLYLRYGATSEWDTAAGQCVLEQAGGRVSDFSGSPLGYNRRESLINPDFFAYADNSADWLSIIVGDVSS